MSLPPSHSCHWNILWANVAFIWPFWPAFAFHRQSFRCMASFYCPAAIIRSIIRQHCRCWRIQHSPTYQPFAWSCGAFARIAGFFWCHGKCYRNCSRSSKYGAHIVNVLLLPLLMFGFILLSLWICFRTRGFATGIAASVDYLMAFSTIKTYYNLETSLSLPGVSLLYCTVATLGLIVLFNILPETENRSLEDIERHFADDTKKWSDWQIPKHVRQAK